MNHVMAPPKVLRDPVRSAHLLGRYVDGTRADGRRPLYTGGWFERLSGGGDEATVRDVITADDIVAVSMLSVQVPDHAELRLLGPDRDEIEHLLGDVPSDMLRAFDIVAWLTGKGYADVLLRD